MKSGSAYKYQTMSLKDICDLPINEIADKDSALFLWVTCPMMMEGIKVIEAWGFKYKTKIYWRKIMSLGMGFWFRGQVEELWLGIKGDVKAFRIQKANVIQSKAESHSKKPRKAYEYIEATGLHPKIELFARQRRPGWDAWGLEIDTTSLLVPVPGESNASNLLCPLRSGSPEGGMPGMPVCNMGPPVGIVGLILVFISVLLPPSNPNYWDNNVTVDVVIGFPEYLLLVGVIGICIGALGVILEEFSKKGVQ